MNGMACAGFMRDGFQFRGEGAAEMFIGFVVPLVFRDSRITRFQIAEIDGDVACDCGDSGFQSGTCGCDPVRSDAGIGVRGGDQGIGFAERFKSGSGEIHEDFPGGSDIHCAGFRMVFEHMEARVRDFGDFTGNPGGVVGAIVRQQDDLKQFRRQWPACEIDLRAERPESGRDCGFLVPRRDGDDEFEGRVRGGEGFQG